MVWTDLSAMTYMVPLIISAFVLLLVADFFGLSSLGNIHCPVCQKKFSDVFALKKHMKCGEEKRVHKFPKAA